MDVLVLHPVGERAPPPVSLRPLLGPLSLVGRLRAAGWSALVEDGSFSTPLELAGRVHARPRPRAVWIHAGAGAGPVVRTLKEEGLVVGCFGPAVRDDARSLLDAGADVAAVSVDAAAEVTARLSIPPWSDNPARLPAPEVLLEVPGVHILDPEGRHRRSRTAPSAPRTRWLLAWDGLDLARHLAWTRARVGRGIIPYLAEPTGIDTGEAGSRVADACLELGATTPDAEIDFEDADLGRSRRFLTGLARTLAAAGARRRVRWVARVDPQRLDQPLLELLSAAGARRLGIPVELGAEGADVPSLNDAIRVARAARRLGVEVALELRIGENRRAGAHLGHALRVLPELGAVEVRVAWPDWVRLHPPEAWLLRWGWAAARARGARPLSSRALEWWLDRRIRGMPDVDPGFRTA